MEHVDRHSSDDARDDGVGVEPAGTARSGGAERAEIAHEEDRPDLGSGLGADTRPQREPTAEPVATPPAGGPPAAGPAAAAPAALPAATAPDATAPAAGGPA